MASIFGINLSTSADIGHFQVLIFSTSHEPFAI